ncbi:MAG: response regulator transcription factor [Acutalibacteraceae bacterium]
MVNILIVEDDISISRLIKVSLTQGGYSCTVANDGLAAADLIEKLRFDLILLDIMLPHIDGYELLRYIKEYNTPVIFITAKYTTQDKVKGLKMGADDYIAKPFEISELLARVEAVLRRYNKTKRYIDINGITIDTSSRTVSKNGRQIQLTLKEYEMLLLFAQNKGIALYRETIYERVWNEPYMGNTRTVDLHVQRLRKKLDLQNRIEAVYKVGYRLNVQE